MEESRPGVQKMLDKSAEFQCYNKYRAVAHWLPMGINPKP